MYSFKNDYSEGAHPSILHALIESNFQQEMGYGDDYFTKKAVELIKLSINRDDVAIHFIPIGTQTNLTALSAFLRPHEAVISPITGHIYVNEAGAIEATGHKVISVPAVEGKLTTKELQDVLNIHTDEHTVRPKVVYISNPTEIGSIYKKADLQALREFCDQHDMYLYIDGARLGSALTSTENDLTLEDIANVTDAFYIGGTKNGALLGEALVICNKELQEYFRYNMKQKGALLAKSRVLGIQFAELFTDNLLFNLAKHSNKMAQKLKEGIAECGYEFLVDSTTNQLFPILPNRIIELLQHKYLFYVWKPLDQHHSAIRLVTSWATTEEAVSEFVDFLKNEKIYNVERENYNLHISTV